MRSHIKMGERVAVVGNIDPDAYGVGAVSSPWIPAKDFEQFLAIVQAGDLGTSATLDAKLEQAQDSSGTGVKDITGKAITQLTQAGTDSNKQAIISLKADELDAANLFDHFRVTVTVGTATSDAAAIVVADSPRRTPISAFDSTTVDEIVS